MSTFRSLQLPERVRSLSLATARGRFAALEAQPTRGVAHRQPALLIPGYTGSKENFLPILEPLAADGRAVVAVDLRGQYQSPHAASRAGYAPADMAADVLAIADAVARDASGVHLAGHSMGGLISRDAVLQRPAGILSLTLLGSGPGPIGGQRADALRQLLAVLDPDGAAGAADKDRLSAMVRQVWHAEHEPQARADGNDEHVVAFLRERTLRTCPLHLIMLARFLLGCPDRTGDLANVVAAGLPAMVVYGEKDDAWPPDVQDQMARQLGAERSCIPEAAHSPAQDAPATTASALTRFWNVAERRQPTVHSCGRRPSTPDPASGAPAADRAQTTSAPAVSQP